MFVAFGAGFTWASMVVAVVAAGKTVWLCPGQGSQKIGMGKDLAARFPAARLTLEAIDEALGFR